MIKKILKKMGYEKIQPQKEEKIAKYKRETNILNHAHTLDNQQKFNDLWYKNFAPQNNIDTRDTMDSNLKAPYLANLAMPELQAIWFASQTFIGYQMCAILAQNWLISKACLIPAKDATRNGYTITVNDGREVDTEVIDKIRALDKDYKINENLLEFVQMGRVFGIRIAMFVVDSDNPTEYYRNPFNPDGVKPGTYRGISQIDPQWITPQLDTRAVSQPASMHFYEPTWWMVDGLLVHRTHLVIFKTENLADTLKPLYNYGGVSIPQKIAERVYSAEKMANDAPMLAMTKRTDVIKTDATKATADYAGFLKRIQQWVYNRDNYGIKVIDIDEEMQQFDTSLSDLDDVIMTQFQLVAAAANIPATKLLGTSPKGFNSSGAYEEANYHEELESIQSHDLTKLLERHYLLLIRSEISPMFQIDYFDVSIAWNELDAMTAKEQAEVNRILAETGSILMQNGAIDASEERCRVIEDPNSGYNGLQENPDEDNESFAEYL